MDPLSTMQPIIMRIVHAINEKIASVKAPFKLIFLPIQVDLQSVMMLLDDPDCCDVSAECYSPGVLQDSSKKKNSEHFKNRLILILLQEVFVDRSSELCTKKQASKI